jgi:hypothetical protein
MGITESLKGAMSQAAKKATEYAGSHKAQIGAGLDKVGDMADKATKGKYKSQIDMGRNKAKEAVDKIGGPKDTIQGEATEKPAQAGPDPTAMHQTGADQTAPDQTAPDQAATDQAATDQTGTHQPPGDQEATK